MCLKSLSIKSSIICSLFTTVLLISPCCVQAQNQTAANKIRSKKTTRLFYGQASFYAGKFEGRRTANGENFSQKKLTCACNVLPLGTWVKITNVKNGRSVIVKINDRIHPKMKRIVDLSKSAAVKLGYVSTGLARVKVEVIDKSRHQLNK